MLLAAAEPVGDPLLLWRASEQLGIGPAVAEAAEADGFLAIGERVTFRHPLVRSAVYRSAAVEDRRAVHLALAEATERESTQTAVRGISLRPPTAPDEEVALELERSAGRAQARGGIAAAAAFLQRAAALTKDSARRADRALAAAQAGLQAGDFEAALRLVAMTEPGPLDELHARGSTCCALSWRSSFRGADATPLLLAAANGSSRWTSSSRARPT